MPDFTLTAADRCDWCGAQAYIRAWMSLESELSFCAHHGREAEPVLKPLAMLWVDETERLHVQLYAAS